MNWSDIQISESGSYHLHKGEALYQRRFDKVLKFHAPGLAPVSVGETGWHIRIDGEDAYCRRFNRTFGFYDNLAAVESPEGWHHITPDGEDLYSERYLWCGNFQEGLCTIRNIQGDYFHIKQDGTPLYKVAWKYAGDFRDGIAVVQDGDGLSTHIDRNGHLLHDRRFLDLDVFHKGYARARDESGWMHVDIDGREIYANRFTMVEPFYNGQARVESKDGSLLLIDERGQTLQTLRAPTRDCFHDLSAALVGFWRTETIKVAVRISLFDYLPTTIDQLSLKTGLTVFGTGRLLNALGEIGLVSQEQEDEWSATEKGGLLCRTHQESLADATKEIGDHIQACWNNLEKALRDDQFIPANIFKAVASDAKRLIVHHNMLSSYARHDYSSLVNSFPIYPEELVFDVGGGAGALAELISERFPQSEVWLGDLPAVVAKVQSVNIQKCGMDFFKHWPIQADVVVLARVLHDWPDELAIRILRNAKKGLKTGGRLIVLDMVRPEKGYAGSLCDLHLLVATGGLERRYTEWQNLMSHSGFTISSVVETQGVPSMLIGESCG